MTVRLYIHDSHTGDVVWEGYPSTPDEVLALADLEPFSLTAVGSTWLYTDSHFKQVD